MIPFKFLFYKRNTIISKTAKIYPFTKFINSSIGDYSYISYNCYVNNCKIGKYCSIARSVKIGLGKHPVNFISSSPLFYSPTNPLKKIISEKLNFTENEQITIGHDVWIGANVIILDGVNIGNGAIIGANTLVTKDVEPYSIVGGVPAKLIRKRFSENIINAFESSKWWDMPTEFFKQEDVKKIFSNEVNDNSVSKLLTLINEFI